jgi:hypothetical protein
MNYEMIKEPPAGYVLAFRFQNPRVKSAPITETSLLNIDGNQIMVHSPALECIRPNTAYRAIIEVFSDETRSEQIGTHRQTVEFSLPEDLMKQLGIVRC